MRRYRCSGCGHLWRQDTSNAAEPRSKLSRTALRWALTGIVVAHLSIARVAEGLAVSWGTANTAVLAAGKRVLINDPHRFDGVCVLSVEPNSPGSGVTGQQSWETRDEMTRSWPSPPSAGEPVRKRPAHLADDDPKNDDRAHDSQGNLLRPWVLVFHALPLRHRSFRLTLLTEPPRASG